MEQRVDLEVVEDVDALYVAEAVVQDSGQLRGRQKKKIKFKRFLFFFRLARISLRSKLHFHCDTQGARSLRASDGADSVG